MAAFDHFRFGDQCAFLGSLRRRLRKKKYSAVNSVLGQYLDADRKLHAKLRTIPRVQSYKRISVSIYRIKHRTSSIFNLAFIKFLVFFFQNGWTRFLSIHVPRRISRGEVQSKEHLLRGLLLHSRLGDTAR